MRQTPAAAVIVALMALAVASVHALDNAPCCPSCSAYQGDCYMYTMTMGVFNHSKTCEQNCWGHCLLMPDGDTWSCGREMCGPDPCAFDAASELRRAIDEDARRLRGASSLKSSHPIGFCKPGKAWQVQLNKTAGINGAYSTAMNVSQTLALKGQHVLVPKLGQNGGGSDVFVRTFESAVFWLYTNPNDEQYYLRSVNATSAVTQYTFSLGGDGDKCAYAASNRAILTVQQQEYGMGFAAYEVDAPGTAISVTTIPWDAGYFNYDWHWPQLRGEVGLVVSPAVNGPNTALFYWNVFDNATVTQVNVTISDCSQSAGGKMIQLDGLREWKVICPEDAAAWRYPFTSAATTSPRQDLTGCTLYFGAVGPDTSETRHFCKMDIATGVVSPVSPKGDYVTAAQGVVQWYPTGVLYSAGNAHSSGPVAGDMLFFEFSTNVFRWIDNEIEHDVTYQMAPAYVNFHEPSAATASNMLAMVRDVVLYPITPSFGTQAYMAYNLTSKQVYPVGLPYGTPNTVCGKYCYGGSCQTCIREDYSGFVAVYGLINGSVVLRRVANDPSSGVEQVALSRFDSSFIVPEVTGCAAGCSVEGGTCVNGQCYCQPGCSGVDCSSGGSFCQPPTPPSDDDDDDDD